MTDWPRSESLLKKRFTISILSLKKQVTIIRVKTLTVCVLSNTANLLRATHTAVNPDALLPSDTKTKRSSTTSQPQYDLGVPDFKQPCYPVHVELNFICTCTSVLIKPYLLGCCYQFPLEQHAAHKHSSLDYLHSSENKRMKFTTMYQLVKFILGFKLTLLWLCKT